GVTVVNTPAASSLSVAELVFAHLLGGVRFLYDAQRKMPVAGDTEFGALKKAYAKGVELRGKTLGVIGFGRIGRETAKVGLGLGMNVIVSDLFKVPASLPLELSGGITVDVPIRQEESAELRPLADFMCSREPVNNKPDSGTG